MTKKSTPLPPLAPVQRIDRPLSVPEYYHACIGSNPRTLAVPREIVFVVEGQASGEFIDWQAALDRVVAANPGMRLRMAGRRHKARWVSDGPPPGLRRVGQCDWDGRSEQGADFIQATTLSLEHGPASELILVGAGNPGGMKVIFRALHAVMDGIGVMHVLLELFRALRGEPLLGTNAAYSDTELMATVPAEEFLLKRFSSASLTGSVQGNQRGGVWRRMTLGGQQLNLLPRIAQIIAEFARRHDETPARVAIPVNLRRHVANLQSTMNFASMLIVDVDPADSIGDIKSRVSDLLQKNIETNHPGMLWIIKHLPVAWLDRLVSRTMMNPSIPPVFETAVLSVMGAFRKEALSCPGFVAEGLYGLPLVESVFVLVFGFQGRYEISVGMANVFASDGRLDAFMKFLEERLTEDCVSSSVVSAA